MPWMRKKRMRRRKREMNVSFEGVCWSQGPGIVKSRKCDFKVTRSKVNQGRSKVIKGGQRSTKVTRSPWVKVLVMSMWVKGQCKKCPLVGSKVNLRAGEWVM